MVRYLAGRHVRTGLRSAASSHRRPYYALRPAAEAPTSVASSPSPITWDHSHSQSRVEPGCQKAYWSCPGLVEGELLRCAAREVNTSVSCSTTTDETGRRARWGDTEVA